MAQSRKKEEIALRRYLMSRFRGSRVRPTMIRPARDSDFAMECKVHGRNAFSQLSNLKDGLQNQDFRSIVTFQGSFVGDDTTLTLQIHVQWPVGESQ